MKASNTEGDDWFGGDVALSGDGNTMAVGAPGKDSSTGAAYLFVRNAGTWTQQAVVTASNAGNGDNFGDSIALSDSGDTLAVGAPYEDSNAIGIGGDKDNNSASASGAVYLFTRSGAIWSEQAYVKASNTGNNDLFGTSVALSADGNTLAVGAPSEGSNATGIGGAQDNNSALWSGAAYIFTRNAGAWTQQAYVKAFNTGGDDEFGTSVALSADGNTLAVGAPYEASNATGINGNENNDDAWGSGAVYLFTRSGIAWSQQAYVKASNTGGGDKFGRAVALSADGDTLAVGADGEYSNATGIGGDQSSDDANEAGAVYLFTRSATTWSQQAYVKASNTGDEDYFGRAVALSADGAALEVGAYGESSDATGIGGDQSSDDANKSGAVYLY